jgi:leucyl-tRNA synthetase
MRRYNPKEIEPKWQKIWAESKIYEATADKSKPKRYVLEYFPYPSGAAMHVGHVRNYTIGDVVSRSMRMQGFNVLHPMGWDAFGLPAENFAIKTGTSPQKAVAANVANFKQQLMQMGFSYDWSREVNSTDPSYYKWTQWFFLFLFEKGLAYQKESLQWWCPHDKTVLANEQVEDGRCWRCGHVVEKKSLKQWFFKITDYADRLANDLDKVNWSPAITQMQRNWIGKSAGAEIEFNLVESDKKIKVYTTRPDTIFGATFLVLSPEHELVPAITHQDHLAEVTKYVRAAERKTEIDRMETEREKTGVFIGAYALNPANDEKIPIWVADYVLPGYGTGAIMAVPAHDERDHEFANKFKLPIIQVIAERFVHEGNPHRNGAELVPRHVVCCIIKHPNDDSYLIVKPQGSDYWSPLMGGVDEGESAEQAARREILEETGFKNFKRLEVRETIIASEFYAQHKSVNRIAYAKVVYVELADMEADEISSAEAEGQEIEWAPRGEVVEKCVGAGTQEIFDVAFGNEPTMAHEGRLIRSGKYNHLTTEDAREQITKEIGKERVNYKIRDWLISRQRYWGAPIPIIHCEKCGSVPVPEKDLPVVLPEVKSYEPSGDGRSPLAIVEEFVNVDCPKCGGPAQRETDTMDGFACSSWYFLRFADPHNNQKPFDKDKAEFWLPVDDYIGGAEHAVMHLLYARFWTKVMYDDGLINFDEPFSSLRNHGMILAPDGQKMSKSKGNTIEPDGLIDQGYGADSIRLMELFIGPWNQAASWSTQGLAGMYRFLQRVWVLFDEFNSAAEQGESNVNEAALLAVSQRTIKKVSRDIERFEFNTAIAAMMSLVNELYKLKAEHGVQKTPAWRQTLESLLLLLAPFTPHIAEELWLELGRETSIHVSAWPTWDEALIEEETMTIVVQVNGKVRAELVVDKEISEAEIIALAKADNNTQKYLGDKSIKKEIYIPGRLINFVI